MYSFGVIFLRFHFGPGVIFLLFFYYFFFLGIGIGVNCYSTVEGTWRLTGSWIFISFSFSF